MLLRDLYESPKKTAVFAFGRMNPPTIGHQKLVEKIKSVPGDHFVFLSHTQKPKTDPLDFATKLKFAQAFFPDVTVGDSNVRTIIQAMQKLEQLGYENIVYVAGSDRVESFSELLQKYNGKEYNFNSINVINAGDRDPDAEGAEGMSASKMREAAATGNFEAFVQGVPDKKLAEKLYQAVRNGMGVKDKQPEVQEAAYEGNIGIMELMKFFAQAKKENPTLVAKVKQLINQKRDKEVWKIIQNYTGTELKGKEFATESISNMLIKEADDIKQQLMQIAKTGKLPYEVRAVMLDAKDRIEQLEAIVGKRGR